LDVERNHWGIISTGREFWLRGLKSRRWQGGVQRYRQALAEIIHVPVKRSNILDAAAEEAACLDEYLAERGEVANNTGLFALTYWKSAERGNSFSQIAFKDDRRSSSMVTVFRA